MHTPSIEALFVRKHEERSYPIAKRLANAPYIGSMARAWIRATTPVTQTLWAILPPIAA